jgi:hypothetical protein
MIQIYLKNIHCHEETNEVGADEPYVPITSVNLSARVSGAGFPVPVPAFEVTRYGFDDVDDEETHSAPGPSQSFWGLDGRPANLLDPNNAIFVVSLMENDNGDPEALRGIVKGIVGGSVLGSLADPRQTKVDKLKRDVSSAMGTPTGAPNFDDPIGVAELQFTADELARAERGERVLRSVEIDGDGGRYELTFEARNPSWQGFELAPPATVSTSGGIGAVSRIPGHMEVFATGANGSVQDRFWYDDGQNWRGFELAVPGSASSSGGLAVVSRIPGHMEVFFIAPNGSVQDRFWYDDGQSWRGFELAPPGSASPTGGITAVSRIPGHMEVFFVGSNGSIQDKFWYDDGQHWRGFELAPAGWASTSGGITAVSRIPGHMEVFFVGSNGSIQDKFWYDDGQHWRGFELQPAGSSPSTGKIAAVSRIPQSMELWYTGEAGQLRDNFWYE